MHKFILILFVAVILNLSAFSNENKYRSIDDLITQNKLTEALTNINAALEKSPKEIDFLVRKSRVETLLGDEVKDEEAKVKAYEKAQETATAAIKLQPNSPKGYNRRAIAQGKLVLFKGILETRSLVLSLREDAKKALELSQVGTYDRALANYLLGRLHLKVAKKPRALRLPLGLGWASKSTGGEFLQKAAEQSPNTISFLLSYAEYLIDNDKKSEAKGLLQKIGTLENFDPADPGHKQTAEKLLSSL